MISTAVLRTVAIRFRNSWLYSPSQLNTTHYWLCTTCIIFWLSQSDLVVGPDFQHILRILNTNIDGRIKVMYALTKVPGVGRRFSNLICKKAEVDHDKR
jgi:Ribosomal protein S13/S18